ncbi:hypothetical protein TNCV_1523351 [Trichonephila clavipes]|nr:hypothetical protein TNCV_1523351 [Trichonephila clavipes]
MALNTFTAAVWEKSEHCYSSRINELFPICRLKINDYQLPRDSKGVAIETSYFNHAFAGLRSRVYVTFGDGAAPGSE